MIMKKLTLLIFLSILFIGCKENTKKTSSLVETEIIENENLETDLKIIPIEHASTVLEWGENTIYWKPLKFFWHPPRRHGRDRAKNG